METLLAEKSSGFANGLSSTQDPTLSRILTERWWQLTLRSFNDYDDDLHLISILAANGCDDDCPLSSVMRPLVSRSSTEVTQNGAMGATNIHPLSVSFH